MPLNSLVSSQPLRFSPVGLSDSLDETDIFPGACAVLQNLVPDLTTKNLWTCRPAAAVQARFASFDTPTDISILFAVGTLIYGLIATARFTGKDEPFCYDLSADAFIPVLGVTADNTPLTQATTGDWTPPTMDLCGVNLVVTHPGFDGAPNYFGWFDTSNPAAPIWHAGNLLGVGGIEALGAITPGTGGTPGVYRNVALTGGSGSGATADITVSGGGVTGVDMRDYGIGYVAADSLSAADADIGSTSGFSVLVSTVSDGLIVFTTVPSWVRQFYGRAYFGVNPPTGQPSAIFTDPLALTCTNANQALTFGDNVKLIAAAPLPLNNQLGGVIQALLVFKEAQNIEQITGDAATMNLAVNTLNVATGTLSPRSICGTPQGVAFLALDGVRLIDFNGHVSDPVGAAGAGVTVPFYSPLSPSRASAACSAAVLRVTIQNSQLEASPYQEYWYDLVRKVWSGPHTLPTSCIVVSENSFVFAAVGVPTKMFLGTSFPNLTSGTIENGAQLLFNFQTAMFRDNEQMAQSEITEAQVKTTQPPGMNGFNVQALDENNSVYNSFFYRFKAMGSLWGSMVWGVDLWGGFGAGLAARRIDFPIPTIFNRLAISVTGGSVQGFKIGDIFIRRRILGYMQEIP